MRVFFVCVKKEEDGGGGYGGQFVNYGQQSSEAGSGFLSPRRDSLRLSTGCGHCVFWAVHPAYFVFFNSIFLILIF